jgi:hypothetical protein
MTDHSPRRINVTIDRVVLRGFAPDARDGIAAGLEAELREQLTGSAQAASFATDRSQAVLKTGVIRPQRDARGLGAQSARRIVAGIGNRRGG